MKHALKRELKDRKRVVAAQDRVAEQRERKIGALRDALKESEVQRKRLDRELAESRDRGLCCDHNCSP